MAEADARPRPLSPHLQVYRLPIYPVLSITHRITGAVLSAGIMALVLWLWAAAYEPEFHESMRRFFLESWGAVLIGGWAVAMYYHLFNGIRHLFWDAGYGYELDTARRSGWAVIILTAFCSLLTLVNIFGVLS